MLLVIREVGRMFNARDVTRTSRPGQRGANSEQMLRLVAELGRQFSGGIGVVDAFTGEAVAGLAALTRA
jgi:hypothetical protein